MSDQTIWGIHAGRTGNADVLFLTKNVVALGWDRLGDLSQLKANRDAFKKAVAEAYPKKKPGAIPNNAGQLFRFMYEMKIGDFVAYPSKSDRKIHIGEIVGEYQYAPKKSPGYPNQRGVKWLKAVQRTKFSQGALYESGSAMSFFLIKNYADEFFAAIEGKVVGPSVPDDETVGIVAEEIEDITSDFILKALAKELKGTGLEFFVAQLLELMDYKTRMTSAGTDGGVDIIAHHDELGFEPPIIKVQVKASEGSIGDPIASSLYGKVGANEFGLLVTLGTFTKQAKDFATSKTNLRLIDGQELVRLILAHYDDFDSKYKGILPLKRVYVPQVVSDSDD